MVPKRTLWIITSFALEQNTIASTCEQHYTNKCCTPNKLARNFPPENLEKSNRLFAHYIRKNVGRRTSLRNIYTANRGKSNRFSRTTVRDLKIFTLHDLIFGDRLPITLHFLVP